ncbi:MAG: hypothetical protein IMX00_02085 [Limnochordales bacterium]|nr:hypothetical protein [Limnochordales bacterium]
MISTSRVARLLLGLGILALSLLLVPALAESASTSEPEQPKEPNSQTQAPLEAQAESTQPGDSLPLGSADYLMVADGIYIRINFGHWLVYLPASASGKAATGSGQAAESVRGYILTETGAGPLPGNNSIPWETGTEYLQFLSSDPEVATVTSNGQLHFLRPGWVQIKVKSRASEVNQLYRVVSLSFGAGAARGDVIAALGQPDFVQPVNVSHPSQTQLHGRTYQPQPGKSISVEHWQWEAYPGLVVVIDPSTGKVDAIINWGQEMMAEAFREATRIRLRL